VTEKDLVGTMVMWRRVARKERCKRVEIRMLVWVNQWRCWYYVSQGMNVLMGVVYIKRFCEGNGAGGEKNVEPQIYHDNCLLA